MHGLQNLEHVSAYWHENAYWKKNPNSSTTNIDQIKYIKMKPNNCLNLNNCLNKINVILNWICKIKQFLNTPHLLMMLIPYLKYTVCQAIITMI